LNRRGSADSCKKGNRSSRGTTVEKGNWAGSAWVQGGGWERCGGSHQGHTLVQFAKNNVEHSQKQKEKKNIKEREIERPTKKMRGEEKERAR